MIVIVISDNDSEWLLPITTNEEKGFFKNIMFNSTKYLSSVHLEMIRNIMFMHLYIFEQKQL